MGYNTDALKSKKRLMIQWCTAKRSIRPMLCAVVMGIVAMCSVTSAQTTWTNEYSTITTQEQTAQTTGTKDLSEF